MNIRVYQALLFNQQDGTESSFRS